MLDFVIIGAQKAGSTFLQERVTAHPDAYTPAGETPFFQDPDYTEAGYQKLVDDLRAQAGDRKIGIKRPNYLGEPEVPARVRQHAPETRLQAVLRDPRERAVSAYFQMMRHRNVPRESIEVALPRILAGDYDTRWPISPTVLQYGRYGEHLERWLQAFPSEQLQVVFYEDIKSDPDGCVRRAYEHFGLDPSFVPPPTEKRPMEGVYSLTRQRINAVGHAIAYQRFDDGRRVLRRQGFVPNAAHALFRGLDRVVWRRLFAARAPKPSPRLRQQLTDYYADDVRKLEELTGRDLTAWRT